MRLPTIPWFAMEEEQYRLIEPEHIFSQQFGLRELANLLIVGPELAKIPHLPSFFATISYPKYIWACYLLSI